MKSVFHIGVMGDSHGDVISIRRVVERAGNVDLWLHTGDFFQDSQILASYSGVPVVAVAGNCDGRIAAKPDEFLQLGGVAVWLTHGHRFGVKQGLEELVDWAMRYEADIVVFGHTHQTLSEQRGSLLLFNPGSVSMPRRGKAGTYGIIELNAQERKIIPWIYSVS